MTAPMTDDDTEAAQRSLVRTASWAGTVSAFSQLRDELRSDELSDLEAQLGRYVATSLISCCDDLIADALRHGPKTSEEHWRRVRAQLNEDAQNRHWWDIAKLGAMVDASVTGQQ